MSETPSVVNGWLTQGATKTTVQVRFASKFSLWVQSDDEELPIAPGEGASLTIRVGDRMIDLGPCCSFPEESSSGHSRRIAPTEKLHDFETLFSRSRVEILDSSLMNLPLLLGHKERVKPAFRAFVSSLTYDLNVYKNLLDKMDLECRTEPRGIREHVEARLLATIGRQLSDYLDAGLERLARAISGFTETDHEKHGYYFRRQMWSFLLSAPFMARTNLKPRGYSGDSEMMRMIYLNSHMGDSTFGKILHKHAVGHPAAQAVRNRRGDVASMIHQSLEKSRSSKGKDTSTRFRVLSVACGPAFELRDVLTSEGDCTRLHFSLLDQDQEALMEAAGLISQIESAYGVKLSADFIRESVRTMLFTPQLRERWGKFDFIYSMGLFDYLTPPVAEAVLRKLYTLLDVGGEMLIGNFSLRNPSRTYMEYWLDWKIIHRSQEDLLELAAALPHAASEVFFDGTGIQMLLRCTKQAGDGEA
jgi:extracellular factor (EF) 3-hydroxypalmitic acid methyl ester biosynthesis protein